MARIGGTVFVVALVAAALSFAPHADAAVTDVSVVWQRDLPGATVRESSPTLLVDKGF